MRAQSNRMNGVSEIIISSPKYGEHIVLVDSEDYERVSKLTWCVSYNRRRNKIQGVRSTDWRRHKTIHLHSFITGFGMTDHINGNVFDNRKCNLRKCSIAENCRNRKKLDTNKYGYKGITFDSRRDKWRARITVDYKRIYSGYCNTKEEAAKKYNELAAKFHGKFARVNIVEVAS